MPEGAALAVADQGRFFRFDAVGLAQHGAKLNRLLVDGVKICGIGQPVLADFKADIPLAVCTAIFAAAAVPAHHIPREGLVGSDAAVFQLADKAVDADLPPAWAVGIPVVAVLVCAQQSVVRPHVAAQGGVVRAGGMHHDPFGVILAPLM